MLRETVRDVPPRVVAPPGMCEKSAAACTSRVDIGPP